MCRVLSYLGPPVTLEALLVAPEHSLLRQAWEPRHQRHGIVNADGFGVGWYDTARRPEPALYRSTRPMWGDRSFSSLAGIVASGAVLAAIRSATPPSVPEETGTPPFGDGPWLFAHNGAVEGFRDRSGGKLRRLLSDRRLGGIQGSSDSEVLFALVLDRLDAGAAPGEALTAVVETVAGVAGGRLNMVLTDGHVIAATAWGDTLYTLTGGRGDAVLIASEPFDDSPDWEETPDGSLVEARPGGITITKLAAPEAARGTPLRPDPRRSEPHETGGEAWR